MADTTETEETTETAGTDGTETNGTEDFAGLKTRLGELTTQRAEFKTNWETAQTEAAAAKEAHDAKIAELQTQLDELTGKSTRHGMERALWDADTEYDDDMLDLISLKYGKVEAGEDGTKPTFDDWFKDFMGKTSLLKKRAREAADTATQVEDKTKTKTETVATEQPGATVADPSQEQIRAMSPEQYGEWRKNRRIIVR